MRPSSSAGGSSCRESTARERSRTWRGEIAGHDAAWLFWEGGGQALAPTAAEAGSPARLLLLVGPEGGFTSEEVGAAGARRGTPREPRPADSPRRVGGAHGGRSLPVPVRGPGRPAERARAGSGGPAVTTRVTSTSTSAADVGVCGLGRGSARVSPAVRARGLQPDRADRRGAAAREPRGGGARRVGRGAPRELAERVPLRSRSRGLRRLRLSRPEVTATGVHALLRGEPIDPARHPRGTVVKAATFHGLEVRETPGRVSARVVLDI